MRGLRSGGKRGGNEGIKSDGIRHELDPEGLMGLVDIDPLAVLPVTAASASAAYARASDPARDDLQRQEQLTLLETTLSVVRELLDSCDYETARLAAELRRSQEGTRCAGLSAVCRRCVGEPLDCSTGVCHCRRCGSTTDLALRDAPCPDPATIVICDAAGVEQVLCLSHAASAVREVNRVAVVAASRHCRAALAEIAAETCVISRRGHRLSDAAGAASW